MRLEKKKKSTRTLPPLSQSRVGVPEPVPQVRISCFVARHAQCSCGGSQRAIRNPCQTLANGGNFRPPRNRTGFCMSCGQVPLREEPREAKCRGHDRIIGKNPSPMALCNDDLRWYGGTPSRSSSTPLPRPLSGCCRRQHCFLLSEVSFPGESGEWQ